MSDMQIVFLQRSGGLSPELRVGLSGPRRGAVRVLVVPGEQVLARWIDAQGLTPAQARAAALFLLAPDLAAPPDACVAGLGPRRETRRLVCVAARSQVERWRSMAGAGGFNATHMIPDHVLLEGAQGSIRVARRDGVLIASGEDLAFAAEPDLARMVLAGRPTEELEIETAALAWARGGGLAHAPDLLAGLPPSTEPKGGKARTSRTLFIGLLALMLGAAAPWIQVWRLDGATRDMRQQAAEALSSITPDAPVGVAPRAALQAELDLLRADPRRLALIADALGAISLAPAADLREVLSDTAGEVRAQVSVASSDDLAPVRARLLELGLVLEEASRPTEDGRILVDLMIRGGR